MSDERIVEVLGEALIDCNVDKRAIRHALAALRAEGWEIIRADSWRLRSDFKLVPVSEGTQPQREKE